MLQKSQDLASVVGRRSSVLPLKRSLTCFLSLSLFGLHGILADLGAAESVPADAARTIPSLIEEALRSNPELRFYEAEIAVAKAAKRSAKSLPNPQFEASVGHKEARGFGLEAEGTAWSVTVVQPFEWPGRIGLRKAIANHDLELATLGEQRFRSTLAARIRTLALELLAAQHASAAADEVADRFAAVQSVLVQRDPSGLTPLLEARVIEATALAAQRKASQARLALQSARLELNQLRGVPPDSPLNVAAEPLAFAAAPDRSTLLARARTNNFDLRVRSTELAQQGLRVELARKERYPPVALGPTFIEEDAGDRERILGVTLSLPIPLWQRNQAAVDSALARRQQAETAFAVAARDLERQVIEAVLHYETHQGELARWRPDAVEHFQEAAALADRHYRLGAVPIATYLELQKQYVEAIDHLFETRRELLDAAHRIELLTGLTPPLVSTAPTPPSPSTPPQP